MTYAEGTRRLYAWSVRTQRLIREALPIWARDDRGPMTKSEAREIAQRAKEEAAKQIAADLEAERISKQKASAARKALAEYHEKTLESIESNPKLL